MKKYLSAAMLGLASFMWSQSNGQGAGSALSFNGQALQSSSINHNIGTGDFTWEAWVKSAIAPNGTSGTGTGIMTNGNYAPCLYASSGGTAPASGYGSLAIYWSGVGGTSWKNSGVKLEANRWYHVAVVRTGTDLSFYVNGVKAPNSYTINATASMSNAAMRLGYSGDGVENLNGNLDEVRVWNVARTQTQIRENMCHKLSGTEANLIVYYQLNEGTGTSISNTVNPAIGTITLPATNAPGWVTSGAAIGDTSVQLYSTNYASQSLALSSSQNGSVTLQNITGAASGVHLYRVNAVPNTSTGIPNAGSNNVYYGTFIADTALPAAATNYDLNYNYGNFSNAVTYASGINLYKRSSATDSWLLGTATNNTSTHILNMAGASNRQEVIIGNFQNTVVCNTPTALNAQNITTHTATLSWTTGGSNVWNLSWGAGSTFVPSAGTQIHNLSATNYILTGLNANTTYSFYVQDSCTAVTGGSAWAGPYTFTTSPDISMGSGTALYFNGSESIQSANAINHNIAAGNFTWEAWINPSKITGSTCIMTNGNYVPALYATTAGSGGNGSVGFYWGGWKNSNTFIEKDKWSHVAMVRSNDTITIFVNGIAAPNVYVMNNTMANSKMRIGWSGDVSEYFMGGIDEVRVWNVARTQEELKADMCMKLQGTETGLINYFPLNEGAGITSNDVVSTASFNAVNADRWRISGAPIGDTSIYIYPQDWANIQLSLSSAAMGQLNVDSISGNVSGMHLYRVNNVPNSDSGIQQLGGTNQYFGVFAVGDYNTANYRLKYDYSAYPAAVSNNANLHIYNRRDNATTPWAQIQANNSLTGNYLNLKQNFGTRQFVLADFTAPLCAAPANIQTSGIDTGNAIIAWQATAANQVLQYGDANFALGSGTQLSLTGNTTTITGLTANHPYEFYIKDSCSATSTSAWVGPFGFNTLDPCPSPVNVVADSITTTQIIVKWDDNGMVTQDYTVSWGVQGFGDPNIGIFNTVTEKRFPLTGINANSSYDFYIRSNCNASVANSNWVGPFTFSTISCDVPSNLNVQNITSNSATVSWVSGGANTYNVQYGASGFAIGTGNIHNNITVPTYSLIGLAANQAYDIYVQDSCSDVLGSSAWLGPVTFTTQATTGVQNVLDANDVTIFPNPAKDNIVIETAKGTLESLLISDNVGQIIFSKNAIESNKIIVRLNQYPAGIYLLKITVSDGSQIVKRIVVQR